MSQSFKTLITGVSSVEELKQKIKDVGLEFKEDENLMIIYSSTNLRSGNEIDDATKSLVIDKNKLSIMVSQFNKLMYNKETIDFLAGKDWKNIKIKYCYEGTMMLVFFAYGKWYVCTRKCLDAKTSFWIKNESYYDLFMDAIDGKFKLEDLNSDYCYHFILLHHKNRNIVNYTQFGKYYKNVALAMTTKTGTLERVDAFVNDKIIYPQTLEFENISEVMKLVERISVLNVNEKRITTEGVIIEHSENGILTLLKIQTPIYSYVASIKPNVSNLDAMFLELYQKNKLVEISPYFTDNSREVVNRIHTSMMAMSNELLNIYHITRSHKNENLYELLPSSYKCTLYALHGKFIQKREHEKNKISELGDHKSITIHDVYNCLKAVESYYLRTLFVERLDLIEDPEISPYLDVMCFDAFLLGKLLQ